MPRDLASRATQTNSAIFSAKMTIGVIIITPIPAPQVPQAAQVSASLGCGCARATPLMSSRLNKAKPDRFRLVTFMCGSPLLQSEVEFGFLSKCDCGDESM